MKLFVTLTLLCVVSVANAYEELPLPSSIPSLDGIIETFRAPLSQKIRELSENFIANETESSVTWRSHTTLDCAGNSVEAGLPVTRINKSSKLLTPTELYEEITYIDCYGEVNLKEIVITRGNNLVPASMNEILKGQRTFKLKSNETERDYRIVNTYSDEMVRINITQNQEKRTTTFYLGGTLFMDFNQLFLQNETRHHYRFSGGSYSYRFRKNSWEITRSFTPWLISGVVSKVNGAISVRYYESSGVQAPLARFLTQFNYGAIDNPHSPPPLARVKSMIGAHLKRFPETQIVASVGQNDQILNELRLAQIRLINNTEINLVKDLITEYLSAIETGTLKFIDNRPKK